MSSFNQKMNRISAEVLHAKDPEGIGGSYVIHTRYPRFIASPYLEEHESQKTMQESILIHGENGWGYKHPCGLILFGFIFLDGQNLPMEKEEVLKKACDKVADILCGDKKDLLIPPLPYSEDEEDETFDEYINRMAREE